ncbi:trans-sulfuration enzyme family protein [Desulfocastanea catecholica]
MKKGTNVENVGWTTRAIHAGQHPDPETGAVSPPIYQTSTFAFESCAQGMARFQGTDPGYIYTRIGNPTTARLEQAVSSLEGGAGGIAVGSGMAALNTILFALLRAGDHLIGTHSVYGPSGMVVERDWSRFGVQSTFVDTSDLSQIKAALRPETRIVFVESPANPTIILTDIEAVARITKAHGALLVVDNTFVSPIVQHPIALGTDIVMHSMTKFINGATDVVSGMIVPSSDELLRRILPVHRYLGACMDPHQAWLVLRGLKTLGMRVRTAQESAKQVAEFLENHPKVEWVRYPGLVSHPQHDLAARQMEGPGCMISFEVKGGTDAGARLLDNVRLMTLAVSLGGIETLIQHPSSMTHASMPREMRLKAGITDGLVRASIGCEEIADLLADFKQALDKV